MCLNEICASVSSPLYETLTTYTPTFCHSTSATSIPKQAYWLSSFKVHVLVFSLCLWYSWFYQSLTPTPVLVHQSLACTRRSRTDGLTQLLSSQSSGELRAADAGARM